MSQKAITRLDLVEGGTEIRQGHHFKLSFSPRDAGGNVVDLTGKKLDVVIVAKQGIVYETTAAYNATEKTVEFSVNENIGHGDMWIEITATDPNNASYRQKFPTAEHEGRLRFVRGTDDIAFVGFSGKTIAEFKAEQTAFQLEIDKKFERAAAALTEDSEVVLARDGEASLNVKLTKDKQAFTAQLAEMGEQIIDVSAGGVLTFQTLFSLKSTYPQGVSFPVWIIADNSWYFWDGNAPAPILQQFYIIKSAPSYGSSGSGGWKGTRFNVSVDKSLNEIAVGIGGSPISWELWKITNDVLSEKVLAGNFNSTIFDSNNYLTSPLPELFDLKAGSYVVMVNYGSGGARNVVLGTSVAIGNDYGVAATAKYAASTTAPVIGQTFLDGYLYDTRLTFTEEGVE